ncbi:F-actin-capping protein subunit beta [Penicillium rubens]|nr:F-actin-capping protein subunit beta [Penicillium rubens]
MLSTACRPRLWIIALLRALRAGIMPILEAVRAGPWGQRNYQLLVGAQEKPSYYHVRITKKTWTVAFSVAAVIFFLRCFPPLPAKLNPIANKRWCDHPISKLTSDASQSFNETLMRQSRSLKDAVTEYRRRYNMPPPPYFDEWYEFATQRNTMLIDEYDTIYHSLQPFWGLSPSTIRSRVREDLGRDNGVMGVSIRNGKPFHLGNGQGDYQGNATMKQFSKFAQWLPDMDLVFNVHDEPRVVVPHEELHRLVTKGYTAQARLNGNSLVNHFSDNNISTEPIREVSTTSPAMNLDGNAPDNSSTFAMEPLGFVFNQTAFSDICNSPSLKHILGIFDRPNAFKLTNELVPMFSTSHLSSFQDIPIPSPWYYEKVGGYQSDHDIPWESRKGQIYWRGGSTGGLSHDGSWRTLQRQRVVASLEHKLGHPILERMAESTCSIGGDDGWKVRRANQTEVSGYFNAHFVAIVFCEGQDCSDEKMFFDVVGRDDENEAWKYRYLLDMDGHAYSGRFYAFLNSKSVPFKLTFFREWHENILFPWIHYVPLNKDGNEIAEIVRFFEQDPAGKEIARTIGEEGQSWAAKTLRNDDMDVYMFRLMLEYARVQDDRREDLGFYFHGS